MTDKNTEIKGKDKFLAGLSNFLETHKRFLYIILAAIVVIIAVAAVIDSVSGKKANEAAVMIEDAQKDYDAWMMMEDDDAEKSAKQQELSDKLSGVADEYPSSYASQRAVYLKAGISFESEEWEEAALLYLESAEVNKDSYLAPIAMMLAASSYENAGSYQNASDIYSDVVADYDKIYPDVPRAMLAVGRLQEQLGNSDAAVDAYNSLLDSYPGSGWASFARTRLIQLD